VAPTRRKILIIQGHPDPQGHHFGHALASAYAKGAVEAGTSCERSTLRHWIFHSCGIAMISNTARHPRQFRQAQTAILDADHIVLIYAVWNGGMPALLKGFLEQTFRPAFIFPDAKCDARLGFFSALKQRRALQGRTARVVATMQMPAFAYRWYFHPHLEKHTLRLSGIRPVRESLIGSV
jgi:putative NADPH-quinone reductase